MNDFDQLVADTLAKILEFGIKNKTVIKTFKRDCKKLGMYLTKTGVRFSLDTGLQWITASQPPPKFLHTLVLPLTQFPSNSKNTLGKEAPINDKSIWIQKLTQMKK